MVIWHSWEQTGYLAQLTNPRARCAGILPGCCAPSQRNAVQFLPWGAHRLQNEWAGLPFSHPCSPQSSAGTLPPCHPATLSPCHAALGTLPIWALASPCSLAGHGHCWQPLCRGEAAAGCIRHFYERKICWRKKTSSSHSPHLYFSSGYSSSSLQRWMKEKSQLTLVASCVCISSWVRCLKLSTCSGVLVWWE